MRDELLLPGAIVLAALLVAVGLWAAGSAIGSGLRCQPVSAAQGEAGFRPLGEDGATRARGC